MYGKINSMSEPNPYSQDYRYPINRPYEDYAGDPAKLQSAPEEVRRDLGPAYPDNPGRNEAAHDGVGYVDQFAAADARIGDFLDRHQSTQLPEEVFANPGLIDRRRIRHHERHHARAFDSIRRYGVALRAGRILTGITTKGHIWPNVITPAEYLGEVDDMHKTGAPNLARLYKMTSLNPLSRQSIWDLREREYWDVRDMEGHAKEVNHARAERISMRTAVGVVRRERASTVWPPSTPRSPRDPATGQRGSYGYKTRNVPTNQSHAAQRHLGNVDVAIGHEAHVIHESTDKILVVATSSHRGGARVLKRMDTSLRRAETLRQDIIRRHNRRNPATPITL